MIRSEHMKSCFSAQMRFVLFKGLGSLKKNFQIGGNVDELKAYRLIPLTPHLLFHFTLPLIRFLIFGVWKSLKKVLIWPKQNFVLKKSKKVPKYAEFHADFKSVEKVLKKCTKWHSPVGLDAISQGPKNSWIPGPNPLPLPLVMDMHASKTLCTGCIKQRCIVVTVEEHSMYLLSVESLVISVMEGPRSSKEDWDRHFLQFNISSWQN
jgi:hypothetical protein